jgi:alpha-amylase
MYKTASSIASHSLGCTYASAYPDRFEKWRCSAAINDITSFFAQYQVKGNTYVDDNDGERYPVKTDPIPNPPENKPPPPPPEESHEEVTVRPPSPLQPGQTRLPHCETFRLDSCSGRSTVYPASDEERSWQTPPRNDASHHSSFQDYRELTGFVDVEYSASREQATLFIKTFTRKSNAALEYNFGKEWTEKNSMVFSKPHVGAVNVTVRLQDKSAYLRLERKFAIHLDVILITCSVLFPLGSSSRLA